MADTAQPTISVIVPVYKVEPYLRRCVDSILAQTFTDFELILVDDGSPDNCGAICDEYAARDERVRVIHQENSGVSSARNAGLDAAIGNYITFVDSDDEILPCFLQHAIDAAQNYQLDIYLAGFSLISQTGEDLSFQTISELRVSKTEKISPELFIELLQVSYITSCWAKLYSRALIASTRFDVNLCFGEDLRFIWTLLQKSQKIMASPETGYLYRETMTSATRGVPTMEKCKSVVLTYQFIFSFDETYWGHKNKIFEDFCKKRWKGDYFAIIRQVNDSHVSFQDKCAMFHTLYSDQQLRKKLPVQEREIYNPYLFYIKMQIKKALKRIKEVFK